MQPEGEDKGKREYGVIDNENRKSADRVHVTAEDYIGGPHP
jgi:hypothetical protein